MSGIIFDLFIFVLACFTGYLAIAKVPPTLHTPLMSGANAISGITILGALIIAGEAGSSMMAHIIGFVAVVFATINVVGGFAVTDRMLEMFKKKDSKGE
jgi:NAD(P) transhydrogenase subunit alpha